MIKLLAADVDGTLLPYGEKEIESKILDKLELLMKKGVRISIASGRSYNDLKRLFQRLGDSVYYITNDGALSVYGGKTVFHKPLSSEVCLNFINRYKTGSDSVVLYARDHAYIFGSTAGFENEKPVPVTSFFSIREPIYKLGAYASVEKEFYPLPSELRLCRKRENLVEYVSRYAEKGTAVSDLQMRFFLAKFDTAAIGNEANDIRMLKNAAYSAAISGSEEDVISAASMQVQNADEFLLYLTEKLG